MTEINLLDCLDNKELNKKLIEDGKMSKDEIKKYIDINKKRPLHASNKINI